MERDTWGISGPEFLWIFIAVTLAAFVVSLVVRSALVRREPMFGYLRTEPQQAAYLSGGPELAVYASLGFLRQSGAIGVGPDRRLATGAPMPVGGSLLDKAVYDAAAKRVSARTLRADPGVAAALVHLQQGLVAAGLALSPAQRGRVRLAALILLPVEVLGIARIVAGIANDKAVGFLVALTVVVSVAMVVLLARAPFRTSGGTAALKALRQDNAHLAPALSPSYATYGAAAAGMGVALFGSAALFAADPAFAEEAELQRVSASGAASGSGGGGGDSGGSSCGGGGCGGGGCGG